MNPIRIAIHGAAGRMGRRLVALAAADPQLAVAAAIEAAGHPLLGHDAGVAAGVGSLGVPISPSLTADVDVVVDFSVPAAAEAMVADRPATSPPAGRGDDRAVCSRRSRNSASPPARSRCSGRPT